ncbi:MAG: four helix bundle protein [Anaerolineae bacterium]|nr:four helix bundle protein [Anaerolineales bacterium]MCQ3978924.1 four helix bundle protein [Anaerolineae bacterium]
MGQINNFQDLEVWQRAHQLVLAVYQTTKHFPIDEKYGLVSQMRRAAVSIPANIAEGFKRRGQADKMRFYNTGETSLEELKYYFILSKDLAYLADTEQLMADAETVSRLLYRLIESINRRR